MPSNMASPGRSCDINWPVGTMYLQQYSVFLIKPLRDPRMHCSLQQYTV